MEPRGSRAELESQLGMVLTYVVLLHAELLPTVGDIAAVVVGVDLAWVETPVMVSPADVERSSVTGLSGHHGSGGDVVPRGPHPLAASLVARG